MKALKWKCIVCNLFFTHRFKLADLSLKDYKIYAAGLCQAFFNRKTGEITKNELFRERELMAGKAALDTLINFKFPEGEPECTKELEELLNKIP